MVGVASARGANDFTTQPQGRPFGKSLSWGKPASHSVGCRPLGAICQGLDIAVVHNPEGRTTALGLEHRESNPARVRE